MQSVFSNTSKDLVAELRGLTKAKQNCQLDRLPQLALPLRKQIFRVGKRIVAMRISGQPGE
jgi:hypothetical protein